MNRIGLSLCALLTAASLTACASQTVLGEQDVPGAASPMANQTALSSKPGQVSKRSSSLQIQFGSRKVTLIPGKTVVTINAASQADLPSVTGNLQCKVTLDGKTVLKGGAKEFASFQPPKNGVYLYTFTVPNDTTSYQLNVRCNFPPEIVFDSDSIAQGEILKITARYADGLTLKATSNLNFNPQFFQDGDALTAFLPIRYTTQPGRYWIKLTGLDSSYQGEFIVVEREFQTQHLTMSPSTAADTALSAAANAEWEQKIEPLKSVSDPMRYWEGKFIKPADAEITTEFGCIRYTNNDPNPSRHGGIDIAADRGTPVLAANSGRVLFADKIQLTGNMAVIEHGFGLKTFYYHMDGLNIKTGDMVEKGQQIGIVGSTGYSTGPHLHFAMTINNVFVNPWTSYDKEF